ncbi:hypothetical protein LAZ67_20001194 [Cordylochernes scorpioides]|uniref:Uncharacterized protein n=1 Tax=Cordylochernes scorpioides TaxID=51811 RepID=A0ABY6LNY8_9ARAC|nr:hypothetical protein LAZ67_20001194 [Cordylochernes scorpioides]
MHTEPEEAQEPGRHSVGDDTYAFSVNGRLVDNGEAASTRKKRTSSILLCDELGFTILIQKQNGNLFFGALQNHLLLRKFAELEVLENKWARSVLDLTAALVAAVLAPPCLRGFMQDAEFSSVNPQLSPGSGATY